MIKFNDCAFQDGSYPCGYKDGGKLPDCTLCHKIRKAGIREVVDFQREIGVIGFGFDAGTEEEENEQRLKWSLQLKKWEL